MNQAIKLKLLKGYYKSKGLDLSESEVKSLQRASAKLTRLAVDYCNGDIDSNEHEPRHARLVDLVRLTLGGHPQKSQVASIEFSNDPRGATLKITLNNGNELFPEEFNEVQS